MGQPRRRFEEGLRASRVWERDARVVRGPLWVPGVEGYDGGTECWRARGAPEMGARGEGTSRGKRRGGERGPPKRAGQGNKEALRETLNEDPKGAVVRGERGPRGVKTCR